MGPAARRAHRCTASNLPLIPWLLPAGCNALSLQPERPEGGRSGGEITWALTCQPIAGADFLLVPLKPGSASDRFPYNGGTRCVTAIRAQPFALHPRHSAARQCQPGLWLPISERAYEDILKTNWRARSDAATQWLPSDKPQSTAPSPQRYL